MNSFMHGPAEAVARSFDVSLPPLPTNLQSLHTYFSNA